MIPDCFYREDAVGPKPIDILGLGVACRSALAIGALCTRVSAGGRKAAFLKVQVQIWENLFKHLAADADNEYAMIDSTIVRAHQHSAGAQKKRGKTKPSGAALKMQVPIKGGLSTKINATVDALGNPTGFTLTPGQACDLDGADVLLPLIEAHTVIADKGYDADERVILPLTQAGKTVIIPPKRNRKVQREYDKDIYKTRHLIENFFCKLKQFRAIATRYDKTARNFLAAIYLASATIWLN